MKNMHKVLSMLLAFAMVVGFIPVMAQAEDMVAVETFDNGAEAFDLYSASAGGFQVIDGKLTPTGEAGEFKAIYKDNGQPIRAVSVEMHPNGNEGMYGGLYIGAANAGNGQDLIDAYYVGIESHFAATETWTDAPNRLDITLGKFAQQWVDHAGDRYISETGNNNALFTGGNKQPIRIHVQMEGNEITVTVNLVNDLDKKVSTVYTLPEGTDLSLGDVGIRSFFNNASYDNFVVEYAAQEVVEDMPSACVGFTNADNFSLYSNSAGGFVAQNSKLVPSGDGGEFKAIYNGSGKVHSVSVELHPVGNDGPICGGLYIGASNAGNEMDQINALYLGIESHFVATEEWTDAPNRLDLIVGEFPTWKEHVRVISETGANNNLFTDGVKKPVRLQAEIVGTLVTVTVSLVSDPSVKISTTYIADRDLSLGQVGIRSQYNNATFDNFTVNGAPKAAAAVMSFDNVDAFDLYSANENGGFITVDGKLVPAGESTELKAIYKSEGQRIQSVSMELHPAGYDGPIYGGLYIGASNAANEQDSIEALYIGVESHFAGWEDAPNRVDLIVGQFPQWIGHSRTVSETAAGNALFAGGVKEPLVLRADIDGNTVTATVSLLSDPTKFISTTYVADRDLSLGQVGIRSHHNNAMYDNFAVNAAAVANGQGYATVNQAMQMAGTSVIRLLGSTDEVITVSGDTTIDLAGYNLTNVFTTPESSLKLADSTSDDFHLGSGWAKVTGPAETFVAADGKQYLAVFADELWTSHRYDAVITHVSLDPDNDALGYKAKLMGDEVVLAHTTGFGFNLGLDGGVARTYTLTGKQEITLRVKNILKNNGGERDIYANAFVSFLVGENKGMYPSVRQTTSMKQALQAVDSVWNSYTIAQQDAVLALCNPYLDTVSGWELNNIFFEGINFADPLSRGEEKVEFSTTKTYQNGLDIPGQWGVGSNTNCGDYGIGDPFVMRYNGKYYMYPSSNEPENGVAGIKVFTSDDLVNWTYEGFAAEDELLNMAYAPEVIYHNGWFYLCTSPGGNGHYIYKSQSPLGPFERITENFKYSIDGSFWVDDNGDLFFLHPKRKNSQVNGIYICSLNPETMLPEDNDTHIESPLPGYEDVSVWVEGPGMFRRGDILYATYCGNRVTEDSYRVAYSYCFGSDPQGTFIQPEDYVLIQEFGPGNFRGLGHNSNVLGPNLDSWYVAYHNLVATSGPQRRYMLDQLVTNGSRVLANGPTYWKTDVPNRPDFEAVSNEGLWYSNVASQAAFTAEFNFTPAENSTTRFLFGYVDEANYCEALWNDSTKTLTVNKITAGNPAVLGTANIDFLAAGVLHTLRVEQGADRLIVYMDTMRKIDVESAGVAGMIGGEGNFGYVAFSNNVFGTGDFDTVKQVEGTFPAVHYLKGENRGFQIANATAGGVRQGEKEYTAYDETTGSYSLKMDTAGDWVKYAIQVNADDTYDLSAVFTAESTGKFQVIVDSQDIYEIDLSNTQGDVLSQLNLTKGKHTLKIRLREGNLQVSQFALTIPTPVVEE